MRKLWITLPILFFGYVGDVEANDDEIHCLAETEKIMCHTRVANPHPSVAKNDKSCFHCSINQSINQWSLAMTFRPLACL